MKALQKDFFREIGRNRGRFISVFFIVLLGAAFFSGLRASERDMLLSAERYYDDTNLMDLRVMGTMGLTDDDLTDIAQIEGVENAYGGYTADVLCDGEQQKAVRLIAYSDEVNLPTVIAGRLPDNSRECFVDEAFLTASGYKIGDTISFLSGNETDLDSTLSCASFTIVGSGNLPYYMDLSRGTGTVGSGKLDGFVIIAPEAFSLEYYTEIYVCLSGAGSMDSFDQEYQEYADATADQMEQISSEACQRRYDSVREEACEKIAEAKQELADAVSELEEARDRISDGEQQILEAEEELTEKQNDLTQGYSQLDSKESELNDAEREYHAQYEAFAEKKDAFVQQRQEVADARAQLEANREQYIQGKAAYEAMLPQLKEAEETLSQINQQIGILEESGMTDTPAYTDLRQRQEELTGFLAQGAALLASLAEFENLEQQTISAEAAVSSYEKQISEGEAQLASARQKIEQGRSQLASARSELDRASQKLNDAQNELDEKKEELEQARADYLQAEQEARPEIETAQQEIADAEEALSKLSFPEWYVLDREMIASYASYQSDAERIGNLGQLLPVIFFFVAALVALTAMTRMVEEQRQQVGVLKALGSGNRSVLLRYLLYTLIPTAFGAASGVMIGEKILPLAIMQTYSMLYTGLPGYLLPYDFTQGFIAVLTSTICTGAATLFACYQVIRANPAQIMRPQAPQKGKRVWLEKIPFLWKKLSFTQKSTVRNMFRYKKRLFMTLFGVAGCMGLVLVGLGLHDSIMVVCDKQFSELTHYQAAVSVDPKEAGLIEEITRELSQNHSVADAMAIYEKNVEVYSDTGVQDAMAEVPETTEQIAKYFTFRDRTDGRRVEFPAEGAMISEKTAALLDVSTGDTVQIKNGDLQPVFVTITAIYENYIGHYVFLSADTYQSLYGACPEYNQLLLCYADQSEDYENELGNYLLQQDGIQGVAFVSETIQWANDTLSSLNAIVSIVLASAGLLALVVLYNLNNINIAERKRELATLKVLGFYDAEVAAYVYKENFLLTIIGICLGMAAGAILHQYVIKSIEVDMIMFGRTIAPISFAIGALLTLAFSVMINVAMYDSLKRIDMIESLKSIE